MQRDLPALDDCPKHSLTLALRDTRLSKSARFYSLQLRTRVQACLFGAVLPQLLEEPVVGEGCNHSFRNKDASGPRVLENAPRSAEPK
jgi:hypothetical protein